MNLFSVPVSPDCGSNSWAAMAVFETVPGYIQLCLQFLSICNKAVVSLLGQRSRGKHVCSTCSDWCGAIGRQF